MLADRLKFLHKRSEAQLHSLVILVLYKMEPLKKSAWEVELFTLGHQHRGRQLAVYLPVLVGQCLEAAVSLYCANIMGTEAVDPVAFYLCVCVYIGAQMLYAFVFP